MNEFLAMGGYASYVWPSFGISLLVLVGAAAWTFARLARARRRLAEIEGRRS
jgi:heme exporter protein D